MPAKASRTRKSYSLQQRKQILEAAVRDGLTANDVKKKFGVTPVTYYSWRKKFGAARRRGAGAVVAAAAVRGRPAGGGDLNSQLRGEVRSRIQQILPEIVRSEVSSYVESLFGARRRGRRRG